MKRLIFINIVMALVLLVCSAVLFTNHIFSSDSIYSNIYVGDVAVGGLSKQTAKDLLEMEFHFNNIAFQLENKRWDYNVNDLGYQYDIEEAVDAAYQYGRDGNILSNLFRIIKAEYLSPQYISIRRKEDPQLLEKVFEEIREQVDVKMKNAKIRIDREIVITPGVVGKTVDMQELARRTKSSLQKKRPDIIEVPILEEKPTITYQYLKQIDGVVGEYSTVFNYNIYNRAHNIQLAAKNIDGTLLHPGESFSFNEKNGNIRADGGFRRAPVIVNKRLQEGIGGGVCQVSSTLYNSVLHANLKVTERHQHSLPSGYVPPGRDATVYGNIADFCFENDKDYPVYIKSYTLGNRVYILIYGNTGKKT